MRIFNLVLDFVRMHKFLIGGIPLGMFLTSVSAAGNTGHQVHYSRIGDFEVKGTVFEVGGRNKSLKQIGKHLDRAYLVKDDILYGGKHEIPLPIWLSLLIRDSNCR